MSQAVSRTQSLYSELARLENQVDDLAFKVAPLQVQEYCSVSPDEAPLCCPLLDELTAHILSGALVVEMQNAATLIVQEKTVLLMQLDQRCQAAAQRLAAAQQKVLAVEQSISTSKAKLQEADVSLKEVGLRIEASEAELLGLRAEEERLSTAVRQHSERTEKTKALQRQLDELISEEAMLNNYQIRMTAELAKTATPKQVQAVTRPSSTLMSALRVTPSWVPTTEKSSKPSFLPRFG
jgi:hypothetical protein